MSLGLEATPGGSARIDLYEFTQGAEAWRKTSADHAVHFRAQDYETCEISSPRGIRFTQERNTSSLEITLPKSDPVAALFIGPLPPNPVGIVVYRAQRQDLEFFVRFSGRVASADFDGALATLKCVSTEAALDRMVPGIVFQSQCNWLWGGTGCGQDPEDYCEEGTVSAVSGFDLHVGLPVSHEDGYFRAGRVRSTAGERRQITSHEGGHLTLNAPFKALAVGETVSLYPGCQRTEADCAAKFNNLIHFMGFPRMPSRNPFTGTI
jgi:uncharacterized phage protein (TIGR02218 family)